MSGYLNIRQMNDYSFLVSGNIDGYIVQKQCATHRSVVKYVRSVLRNTNNVRIDIEPTLGCESGWLKQQLCC